MFLPMGLITIPLLPDCMDLRGNESNQQRIWQTLFVWSWRKRGYPVFVVIIGQRMVDMFSLNEEDDIILTIWVLNALRWKEQDYLQ